ncbi:MAG: hypothetical protein ACI9ZF_003216, partial [Bradyrhizobium sp.]
TVKRRCADDSASTRVKVGHRQAKLQAANREALRKKGLFALGARLGFTLLAGYNPDQKRLETVANIERIS